MAHQPPTIITEDLVHAIFATKPELEQYLPKGVFTKLQGQTVKLALDSLEVTKIALAGRKTTASRTKELEAIHFLTHSLKEILLGTHKTTYLNFLNDAKATTTTHAPIKKVVIIGSGIAGLSAARELQKHNVEFEIVEGRDYVGGRLHTVDGLDLGGHWIHGGGPDPQLELKELPKEETNPIRNICDELGIETVLTDGDSTYVGNGETRKIFFYDSDFTPLSPEKEGVFWAGYEDAISNFDTQIKEILRLKKEKAYIPKSLESAFEAYQKSRRLSEFERLAINWHKETQFGSDYAEDCEKQSFLFHHGLDVGEYQSYPGGDRALKLGYSELVNKIAEPFLDKIHLNETVVEIEHGPDHDNNYVKVITKSGKVYEGDAALVTVPLGVLKKKKGKPGHIAFNPKLPKEKQTVIDRMKMACLNKVFLEFDKCYWPKDQYTFAYINKKKDEYPSLFLNMWPSHQVPILALLTGGTAGRQMGERTQEQNLKWAMPFLRKFFPDLPDPIKYTQTCWQNDPFAYGSYSCANVGIESQDMTILGQPVDSRLFFAGEATQPLYWGCVHGAYLTGLREAARITGDWSILPAEQKTVDRKSVQSYVRSHKVYQALKKKSPAELRQLFKEFDTDKDGVLSPAELREGFFKLGLNIPIGDATVIHQEFDTDTSGTLSVDEFLVFKTQPAPK
eukprot:TRINITY_DN6019_c0_g1_i1.p1 TRINITY_DN6019_c0_g1~~TRINITY_DN6019_c0_g1_i1.p1  ORF type:complete len:678 (+),score=165.35 TRINITY_DN6019_c0_g1_i1:40-2073(+)